MLPSVDILITSAGENRDTILNAVRAVCESDYPQDLLRVVLLDDGRSTLLRFAIWNLKRRYPTLRLHYATRTKPKILDFKAGNLNFGLKFTKMLADDVLKKPAPFVACVDADMIINTDWLRKTVPHLLLDPHLGMTCTPQVTPGHVFI